jgi:hypothetical protein
VLPWVRLTGGAPSPSGADPTGHSMLLQHELAEVGQRCRWLMEPVDYLAFRLSANRWRRPPMILSWLTDNRPGTAFGYHADLVEGQARSSTAAGTSTDCPCRTAGKSGGGVNCRWGPVSPESRILAAIVGSGRSDHTIPTWPSPPPPGSRPGCPSRRPTCCTQSRQFPGSTPTSR